MLTLPTDSPQVAVSSALTPQEKVRLHQLERVVEAHLDGLLAAGKALAEIRSSRLYRQHFATFEQYVRERWALSRSRADELCRSNATAELLIASGATLPDGISEAALRPISALPAELQPTTWRLVEAAAPKCGPTQPVVSKVCRTIRNAIEPANGAESAGPKPRSRTHPSREVAFVAPVQRLSAYRGFDAALATAHVEKLPSALSVYSACGKMIERCESVRNTLVERFPELCQPTH